MNNPWIKTGALVASVVLGAMAQSLAPQTRREPQFARVAVSHAQAADTVPAGRLAAREWYRDARFGLFVHWGAYSQVAQGEWVMPESGKVRYVRERPT